MSLYNSLELFSFYVRVKRSNGDLLYYWCRSLGKNETGWKPPSRNASEYPSIIFDRPCSKPLIRWLLKLLQCAQNNYFTKIGGGKIAPLSQRSVATQVSKSWAANNKCKSKYDTLLGSIRKWWVFDKLIDFE